MYEFMHQRPNEDFHWQKSNILSLCPPPDFYWSLVGNWVLTDLCCWSVAHIASHKLELAASLTTCTHPANWTLLPHPLTASGGIRPCPVELLWNKLGWNYWITKCGYGDTTVPSLQNPVYMWKARDVFELYSVPSIQSEYLLSGNTFLTPPDFSGRGLLTGSQSIGRGRVSFEPTETHSCRRGSTVGGGEWWIWSLRKTPPHPEAVK